MWRSRACRGIYVSNLTKAGADLLHGKASFKDAHTVEVKGRDGVVKTVTAEKVLIAVGGRPLMPKTVPGIELAISSNEAFHLPELPERIVIVGGGYIAVEFACIFHGLGSDVTLVYRGPNLLRGFDEDVRSHVAGELKKRGLKVILACEHERIEKREDGVLVSHVIGDMALESEVVMFATGREPYVEGPASGEGRREAERQGRRAGGRLFEDQRRQRLGGGRRDGPHQPDPRRHPRGPGLRLHRIQRSSHDLRPQGRGPRPSSRSRPSARSA